MLENTALKRLQTLILLKRCSVYLFILKYLLETQKNRLQEAGTDSYTYDANGNMTSITNGCGTTTYNWDARNILVGISGFTLTSASTCNPLVASFRYDALGRRIEKTINGRTIQYLYDGLDIVQEIENGQVTVNYIRTLNIDEPLARLMLNASCFYQTDALGSVIGLTTENGQLSTEYAYDPYGNVTISGDPSDNPFQYTGRENDGTGLYYYRARYYSPELQRFISEDPILHPANGPPQCCRSGSCQNVPTPSFEALLENPQTLNPYVYVQNRPTILTDPAGLGPPSECYSYTVYCLAGDPYACGAQVICYTAGNDQDSNCIRNCLLSLYQFRQSPAETLIEHGYCYVKCLCR